MIARSVRESTTRSMWRTRCERTSESWSLLRRVVSGSCTGTCWEGMSRLCTVGRCLWMPLHTTDALILRTYKLGESDRIVVFLTRDRGKKRGVAKNARQSRRRFGGALEPMTCGRVGYVERERRDLVRLDYVEALRSPLSAVDGEALGYVELLRRADRRVGAGGRSERDAVPARRVDGRGDRRAACRSSRWRAISSSGCCGCRASTRSIARLSDEARRFLRTARAVEPVRAGARRRVARARCGSSKRRIAR